MEYEKLTQMYEYYIAYVRHENNLINQRATWLITVQSIFITIVGFFLNRYFDIYSRYLHYATPINILIVSSCSLFLGIVCIIGIITTLMGRVSIRAARLAQNNLYKAWHDENLVKSQEGRSLSFAEQAAAIGLPALLGGGSERTSIDKAQVYKEGRSALDVRGGEFAVNMPTLFIAAWFFMSLVVLAMSVYAMVCWFNPSLLDSYLNNALSNVLHLGVRR